MERHNTLDVLNPRAESSDGNSLVEVIYLELFLVELVDELLE